MRLLKIEELSYTFKNKNTLVKYSRGIRNQLYVHRIGVFVMTKCGLWKMN